MGLEASAALTGVVVLVGLPSKGREGTFGSSGVVALDSTGFRNAKTVDSSSLVKILLKHFPIVLDGFWWRV